MLQLPISLEHKTDYNIDCSNYGRTETPLNYGRTETPLNYGRTETPLNYGRTETPLNYGRTETPISHIPEQTIICFQTREENKVMGYYVINHFLIYTDWTVLHTS
jgi:hypothetical protein